MTKVEELAESMSQKIWLDISEPQLPLKDRYRLMKDRIVYGLNAAHAEGAAEERERIRKLGTLHDKGQSFPFYSVVASVLAPPKGREP